MAFWGRINLSGLALATLLVANGCSPMDSSQSDEQLEPHFVQGNTKCNEMDWNGAVESFEQSLEVNPHSAQAHYRLAQLFDTKVPDPAAAIYHYEQYLKLSQNPDNRDVVKQRIDSCKQQLATDVMQLPSAPAAQKQVDSLVQQNRQLQAQVDQLNGVIKQWNAYYASLQAAQRATPANNSGTQTPTTSATPDDISPEPAQPVQSTQPTQARLQTQLRATPVTPRPVPAKARTHVVTSGETMASIARKQRVSLSALQSANPHVNPKHLRVGQTLNLPP